MRLGLNGRRSFASQLFPRSRFSRPSKRRTPPPLTTPSEFATWVVWTGVFHASFEGTRIRVSNMYGEWKANHDMQHMLEELDSKKKESPEAYLEMIELALLRASVVFSMEREIESLKPKLSKRERLSDWEVNFIERKISVLESKLYAWMKGEDTAPCPSGVSMAK